MKITTRNLLLIIITCLSLLIGALVIYYNKTSIFSSDNHINQGIDSLNNNARALENAATTNLEPQCSLINNWLSSLQDSMMTKSAKQDSIDNKEEPKNFSNPEIILEKQKKEGSNKQVTFFLSYLHNINLLIINFLQDRSYTEQISQIAQLNANKLLPVKIKNILNDLNSYNNNYLSEDNANRTRVFPKNHSNYQLLEKFIRIEKKSVITKESEKFREQIIGNLEAFINYFYTQEFVELLTGSEQ